MTLSIDPPTAARGPAPEATPLIDVDTLRARRGDASLRIIDARFDLADADAGRRAFAASRIPGAVYAHLDDDLSDHGKPAAEGRHPLPDAKHVAATLARWRITPSTPVVVYDAGSGAMAAARAWWLLRWMGHVDVRVLDGGFAAWMAAGAVVECGNGESESDRRAAARPSARDERDPATDGWRPGSAPTFDANAVASRDADVVLVDARARERFRGDVEPLDPKAGHIPGAINRPFTANLDAGRFKSAARLRDEWRALLPEGSAPLLSCGSGVTACHNALALVHAGWPMPVLYPPSWSGWVSDVERAVATGE
jgi:thiosulfate/3-mercaptopyruvate sulfurtransferase